MPLRSSLLPVPLALPLPGAAGAALSDDAILACRALADTSTQLRRVR